MKKRCGFKTIYGRFAFISVGTLWFLNTIVFARVLGFLMEKEQILGDLHNIKFRMGITFFASACIGTLFLLLILKSIVKPLKALSIASMEVAKGNYTVYVEPRTCDEVGQLTQNFNVMVKAIASTDALRKDFVSNVSHEFRTPITSIRGFAKLIEADEISAEKRLEYSRIIVEESQRLMALSNNLLWLSELESQVIEKESSEFSLDEQIRKVILILENDWEKKSIDFILELAPVVYRGKEYLLEEVWLNLIQNAIKFSGEESAIKIYLYEQDGFITVKIIDEGMGIPVENQDKIFERFYKSNPRGSKEGTGLGLVIVKKIIDMLGGQLSLESKVGFGSQFTIKLPVSDDSLTLVKNKSENPLV